MKLGLGSLLLALGILAPCVGAQGDTVPVLIAPFPPLDTPVGSWLAPYDLNAFFAPYEEGPIAEFATEKGKVSVRLDPNRVQLVARFIDFSALGEYENTIIHHSADGVLGGGAVRIIGDDSVGWDLESTDRRAVWFVDAKTKQFYLRRFQNDGSFEDIAAGTVIAGSEALTTIANIPTYGSPNERLKDFSVVPLENYGSSLTFANFVLVSDIAIQAPTKVPLVFELIENEAEDQLHAEIVDGRLQLKGLKASTGVIIRFRVTAQGGQSREYVLNVPVIEDSWSGYFPDTSFWGQGWTNAGTLGWLYVDMFPWVYSFDHNWLYCAGEGGLAYTMYDQALGWLFITPWPDDSEENPLNQYPFVYRYESDEWLWFAYSMENGERWFWSYKASRWIWTFESEMGYDPPLEDEADEE